MKPIEQRKAASDFVKRWSDRGYEKGQAEPFWMALLRDCYGVEMPEEVIKFEDPLKVEESNRFVDGKIPSTRVMIEQKGSRIDLTKPDKQSGLAEKLTPFQQAHRYVLGLPVSEHPRWIVVCNFREFHIHDMERPNNPPEIVLLENLPDELHRLRFLVNVESTHVQSEEQVSVKAGKLVGELYDKLFAQYGDKPTEEDLRSLNVLCVRLVFCLYAEDAHVFEKDDQFHDYLSMFSAADMRDALIRLFRILNTHKDYRSKFERPELLAFPYVNGGLFDETKHPIEIPMFTEELRSLLLDKVSYGFDWSEISPTIFGAVFENTLNPKERRKGGMHYTTIENIHKVIDPLFLDLLTAELDTLLSEPESKIRKRKLEAYQDKLAAIRVMDPACGSGNFLTETFLSLRRLENRVIRGLRGMQVVMGEFVNPIKVSIEQFYGIEINDFAVNVAKTAMWIAESQMQKETQTIVTMNDDFLPLTRQTHIHHGNALRTDWSEVAPAESLSYIIGNPPFLGCKVQTDEQREELADVLADGRSKKETPKTLDYVAGWYTKTAQVLHANPKIRAALVSTNSITQGEQVSLMWKPLVEKYGLWIDFAHRTFVWDGKANVHCVIIGLGVGERSRMPVIYNGETTTVASHINPYLVDMGDVWIETNKKQVSGAPLIRKGSQPTGNFFVTDEERVMLQEKYPEIMPYVREFVGAKEFLNGIKRYCLWLKDAPVSVIRKCPWLTERIDAIRAQRLASTKSATRRKAERPMLFDEDRQPDTDYMIVPCHSSGNREYIPIGFMSKEVICGNANQFIPNATPYSFGILTSSTHMIWTNVIGGRIKSDPRYSNDIVYNNFPWPEANEEEKGKVSAFAQAVLDIRGDQEEKGDSLADMYDPRYMPPKLRKAHRDLDRAVLKLYGLKPDADEMDIVKHLLALYKKFVQQNENKPKKSKK